jgi:DNA-binding CsgD family transcriptional regulator
MKLPAGMMDCDVEFFLYKDELMILHDSKIKSFERIPADVKYYLEQLLAADSDACLCLDCLDLHDPMDRLRQFALCRFSSFDLVADLTEGGNSSPEFSICDKRGRCPFEGTLCTALLNYDRLSFREIQVILVMAKGLPNKLMVDELGISINTISTHIQNICNKIGVQSKTEILIWAMKHHLLDHFFEEQIEEKQTTWRTY